MWVRIPPLHHGSALESTDSKPITEGRLHKHKIDVNKIVKFERIAVAV